MRTELGYNREYKKEGVVGMKPLSERDENNAAVNVVNMSNVNYSRNEATL